MEYVFIVFLSILAGLSSLISYLDKKPKGKKLPKNLRHLILINGLIVVCSIGQLVNNKLELKRNGILAEEKQNKRDALLLSTYDSSLVVMKSKYDTSNLRTIGLLTETLGKYGYMLDSANQKLMKLVRDSAKIRVLMPQDPVLFIPTDEGFKIIKDGEKRYCMQIGFVSTQAASSNFDITCDFLLRDSLLQIIGFIENSQLLYKDQKISTDHMLQPLIWVDSKPTEQPRHIDMLIKGTYTNLDNTKKFSINELYGYNFKTKSFALLSGHTATLVLKIMDEHRRKH